MKKRNWCHCELYVYFRKYVFVLADLFSFLHLFLSLRFKTNTQIFWRVFFRSYNEDVFFVWRLYMKIFWRVFIRYFWRWNSQIYFGGYSKRYFGGYIHEDILEDINKDSLEDICNCTLYMKIFFSIFIKYFAGSYIKNTHEEILKIFFRRPFSYLWTLNNNICLSILKKYV